MQEKRENQRIGVAFPVECMILPERKSYFSTVSKDLSLGGAKILCDSFLPSGKKIKVNINLVSEIAVAKAQVIWCNKMAYSERYCAGVKFLEMNKRNKENLSAFINRACLA